MLGSMVPIAVPTLDRNPSLQWKTTSLTYTRKARIPRKAMWFLPLVLGASPCLWRWNCGAWCRSSYNRNGPAMLTTNTSMSYSYGSWSVTFTDINTDQAMVNGNCPCFTNNCSVYYCTQPRFSFYRVDLATIARRRPRRRRRPQGPPRRQRQRQPRRQRQQGPRQRQRQQGPRRRPRQQRRRPLMSTSTTATTTTTTTTMTAVTANVAIATQISTSGGERPPGRQTPRLAPGFTSASV